MSIDIYTNSMTSYHKSLEQDDADSFTDEAIDFAKYGLSGALASGAVGMYNSAKSLGNLFGGDFERTKVGDVLDSLGMDDTEDYYQDNKDLIDGIGFVASSLIPGAIGLKAANLAQAGLRGANSGLALGLSKALVPVNQIEKFRKNIQKNSSVIATRGNRIAMAAKEGFHQAAVEGVFMETAILAMTAENPSMTSGELDYFRAISSNYGYSAIGVGFASVLGGVAKTAVNFSTIKRIASDQLTKQANELIIGQVDTLSNRLNIIPGDRVADLVAKKDQLLEQQAKMASGKKLGNEAMKADAEQKIKDMDNEIYDEIAKLTEEMKDGEFKDNVIRDVLVNTIKGMKEDDKFNLLAGLQRAGTVEDVDILFDPVAVGLQIVGDDDWIETVGKKAFGKNYNAKDKKQEGAIRQLFEDDNAVVAYGDTVGSSSITIRDEIFKNGTPEDAQKLLRAELGKPVTSRLRDVLDMEVNAGVKKELENLSRLNRPTEWDSLAPIAVERGKLQSMMANATSEELEASAAKLDFLDGITMSLSNPEDLLADAWAVLSNPALRKDGEKLGPNVLKLLQGNAAVKQKLGLSEALVDMKNGNMFNVSDRTPTVRDVGTVTYNQRFKTVTHRDGVTKIDKNFNVLDSNPTDSSAHYFAASKQARTETTKDIEVDWTNFSEINKVIARMEDGKFDGAISIKIDDVVNRTFAVTKENTEESLAQMLQYYKGLKSKASQELRMADKGYSESDIARIIDADEEFVSANGGTGGEAFWSRTYEPNTPTVVKLFYKNRPEIVDGSAIEGLAQSRLRIREAQTHANASINDLLRDLDTGLSDMLPPSAIETGINYSRNSTAIDDTTGAAAAAQGQYGKGSSFSQIVASAHAQIKSKGHNKILLDIEAADTILRNKPEGLAEAAVVDTLLRQKFYTFVPKLPAGASMQDLFMARVTSNNAKKVQNNINKLMKSPVAQQLAAKIAKPNTLMSLDLMDAIDVAVNSGRLSEPQMRRVTDLLDADIYDIANPELADYWRANVKANSGIVKGKRTIAGIKGLDTNIRDDVLYPGSIDTKRYKFVEFVHAKNGVFREDKPGMIGAADEVTLQERKQKLIEAYGDDIEFVRPEESQEFFKRRGIYDTNAALTDWQTNSMLKRKGVLWDVAPEASPQLLDHYRSQLIGQWSRVTDNLVQMKYSEEFASLEAYSNMAEMAKPTLGKGSEKGNNYSATAALMLNRENKDAFQGWKSAQEGMDKAISKVYNTVKYGLFNARTKNDYESLQKYMDKAGMPRVYNEKVGKFFAESEGVSEQVLSELIPKLNGLAATFMLRLDYIQPFINAISTPITSFPEIRHLVDSVPELARQQATTELRVGMPSTGLMTAMSGKELPKYNMFSNMKLMQQAMADFWRKPELAKEYYERGYSSSIVREMRDVADQIALDPKLLKEAGIKAYDKPIQAAIDFLAKPADWSEEFVKFTAARMADLVLTKAGITDDAIKNMAINTFTKRVHGNYTYAQRPALFQGIAGQAIGLFQTYQFNLFQQLLRHVGDKQVGAAASMMGLQAGIFGTQSVPGFRMMSEHIGEKSLEGNDFYTGTQDAVGDELSEWILYGMSSNFTKPMIGHGLELYTRGDLNPRTPFIIPTSIDEVPIYSLATKFAGSIMQAADALAEGAPAGQVFAEALATNGVNRPLANLGQMIAGGRTTNKGTLMASTQDLDWWQRGARLLGTKTLDESIAVQAFYRGKGYESARQNSVNQLGRNARVTTRGEGWDGDTYQHFMRQYAKSGGDIQNFDKWAHRQAMSATQSQIYDMANRNDSAQGRYLQRIMGGEVDQYIGVNYE